MPKTLKAIFDRNAGSGWHRLKTTVNSSTASTELTNCGATHSGLVRTIGSLKGTISYGSSGAGTAVSAGGFVGAAAGWVAGVPQAASARLAITSTPSTLNRVWRFTDSPPRECHGFVG